MRTKKLFLKLFLAAFFLAVFIPKDVHAAQTPINVGNTYGNSITISGTASSPVVTDGSGAEIANNREGYNFTGVANNKKITIEIEGTLNLTFTDLRLLEGSQLEIKKGIVNISLKNSTLTNSTVQNTNGSAIIIADESKVIFSNDGKVMVEGHGASGHAVTGGTNGNLEVACSSKGSVTLSVDDTNADPFNGNILTATSGNLRCERNGQLAKFGHKYLYLDGANVDADGIVSVSFIDESLTGFDSNTQHKITYINDKGTVSTLPTADTIANSSGMIKLLDEFDVFDRYITVDDAQRIKLKPRPAKPTNIKQSNEEIAYTNTGSITLPSAEYEYMATTGNSTWDTPNPPDYTAKNLPPGDYKVRKKATDSAFASESATITLKLGRLLTVTAPTWDAVTYSDEKHENPDSKAFKIESHEINDSITISSIYPAPNSKTDWYTLSGDPDNISNTIPASGTDTNVVSLQPNSKLDAGTYTAKFYFSYRVGSSTSPKSTEDPVTVTFTVEPKKQPQPTIGVGEFEVKKVTYNSIELTPVSAPAGVDAVEYSIDGTKWVKEPSFTGLTQDTDYKVQVRSKGDAPNYIASDPVEVQVHTEVAAKFDFINERIDMPPYSDRNYTITVGNETINAQGNDKIDIKESWFDKTVTIHDVTNNYDQTLTIQKRAAAPTNLKATDETIASYHDGKITGANTSMQYKLESWEEWAPCANIEKNTIENLEPGKYYVRIAPTETKFASASAEIIIKKGKVISVEPIEFDSMTYGTVPDAKAITITNHDKKNPVTIIGMSIDPNAFVVSEGDKTVAASDQISNWKLAPKEKLNVGTYTAELVVSYTDSPITTPEEPGDTEEPGGDTETPGGTTNPDDTKDPDTEDPGGTTNPDDTKDPDTEEPGDTTNPGGTTDPDDTKEPGNETEDSKDTNLSKLAKEDETVDDNTEEQLEPVSIPVEITVTKAEQDPPPVPSEKSKTATSVTLETIPNSPISGAKAQYSKDGGKTWQDSPTFTGLSANREYTFVARYAETENYNASEISAGEIAITTDPKTDSSDVSKNATDNNSNGSKSNGTNGNGSGNGTNGTSGTSGTGTDGTSGVLSSAKTGDMNNIQLWVTLAIISYLSCMIIIKNRMKQSRA